MGSVGCRGDGIGCRLVSLYPSHILTPSIHIVLFFLVLLRLVVLSLGSAYGSAHLGCNSGRGFTSGPCIISLLEWPLKARVWNFRAAAFSARVDGGAFRRRSSVPHNVYPVYFPTTPTALSWPHIEAAVSPPTASSFAPRAAVCSFPVVQQNCSSSG